MTVNDIPDWHVGRDLECFGPDLPQRLSAAASVVLFTRAEMDAWIKGVMAGEFDDLG